MSVNNSNHVSPQALAHYEIPDQQRTNYWNSLPHEIIYRIFNFVLSGKSEDPSPNTLLRLIRLNCKTVCRISLASKKISKWFFNYFNKIGEIANKDSEAWKLELKANCANVPYIEFLHNHLRLAKEITSCRNLSQRETVGRGCISAAELCAYGLLSYQQVIDLISSLPAEIKKSGYTFICYRSLEMNLFPLVVRLIHENYIINRDKLIKIKQKILSNIKLLDDDLDQDVITFIHYEIVHEKLSVIFPYTESKFHDVLDYALERGFFQDNFELIQEFIKKNSPGDSYELEKKLGERAYLKNIFFENFLKRHLFDQALDFGKAFKMKLTTMVSYLIREKQYESALDLISVFNNDQMNNIILDLLHHYFDNNKALVDFFSIILNHEKIKEVDALLAHFISIISNKLNPLRLEVVIIFSQKIGEGHLLEHFDWQLPDEKEFLKSMEWVSIRIKNENKIEQMLISLAKRMKIKFDPLMLEDLYRCRAVIYRSHVAANYSCSSCWCYSADEVEQKFLVEVYRLFCETTLDSSRKLWFKGFFNLFPSDSLFMQEFEKISPEHAAWIQEIRSAEQKM